MGINTPITVATEFREVLILNQETCGLCFQLWILPSLLGGSVLYFLSVDQWHRVAAWLYGSGLTGLFITSTLFHAAAWKISHLRCVKRELAGSMLNVQSCL